MSMLRALARESNGSIVDLTSGRRVRTPQPKVWMHVQMKESFDKPLSQETTTSMSDVFLTMGALYSLDETDPDFSKEAKLTTKQRDDLPSTAFCGPDRSFPAHDRVHATQGLRMLGRYKGPGNKSAIRACLMRKLKSKKEAFEDIAILRNESLSIDTPILRAYVSESAPDFIARLESLNLPDAEPIKERYVRFASLNDVELPADLQSVSPSETADPVVINADEKNWPILYNFTEGVDEHSFDELLDVLLDTYDEEEVQEQESKEKEESETADLSKNEDFVAKSLLEESNSKVEALEAKIKDLEQAAPPAAPTGIYSKEDVDTLRKQILKMQGELHKNKAAEVARLKKIAGRKYAKDLTVEELTNAHLTRTVESLNDDLTELMSEIDFKHIVPVDYSSTNVPSPVVQLNNGPSNANTESPITPVVIDPLTGMPTIESSNITTEEDDTYTITLGLDPKVIARRSAEIAKSYSR
jgi:polyhydroxyalkanoate synthesis regulator phasin